MIGFSIECGQLIFILKNVSLVQINLLEQ